MGTEDRANRVFFLKTLNNPPIGYERPPIPSYQYCSEKLIVVINIHYPSDLATLTSNPSTQEAKAGGAQIGG